MLISSLLFTLMKNKKGIHFWPLQALEELSAILEEISGRTINGLITL
jgi:hypothetical protein